MTCWQDHMVIYTINFLIRNLVYIDESYYLVVGSSHGRNTTHAGDYPHPLLHSLN
jgi:hypothetical protein